MDNFLTYSIMPLDGEHVEEYVKDIEFQYKTGVTTIPLFCLNLTPEGNPVTDKVSFVIENYSKYKVQLDKLKIPSGFLVQFSIGHGGVLPNGPAFTPLTSFETGKESQGACCPLDNNFREYFKEVMAKLASCHPSCIMLDDDMRTLQRAERGCACEEHINLFNKRAGTNFTRQELWDICCSNTKDGKKYWELWQEIQKESLVLLANAMREGIDSVDPTVQGVICTPQSRENVAMAKVFAGKNNKTIARGQGGRYAPTSTRHYSMYFYLASSSYNYLKDYVDIPLAESDTCPRTRYSASASVFNFHFTGSILEGYKGAKHWMTPLLAYEMQSGKAFKKTMAKFNGFHRQLTKDFDHLTYRGFRAPLIYTTPKSPKDNFATFEDKSIYFINYCFERLGFPIYFSNKKGGILTLNGNCLDTFSDDDIKDMLSGNVLLASDTAELLIKRGFAKYIGVEVRDWKGKNINAEECALDGAKLRHQYQMKELIPASNAVKIYANALNTPDRINFESLFPSMVGFRNELGGYIVTISGIPNAPFDVSGFGLLNETRKRIFAEMLKDFGEFVCYYDSDEEMLLKVADMDSGEIFVALFPTSYDIIDEIKLSVNRKVSEIRYLTPDGKKEGISFTQDGEKVIIPLITYPLQPQILYLK